MYIYIYTQSMYIYIYIYHVYVYIYIYTHTYMCIYIYIYTHTHTYRVRIHGADGSRAASLRTKILDFRGFHSSIIVSLRGGIPRPIGNFPESSSQAILPSRDNVSREIGRMMALTSRIWWFPGWISEANDHFKECVSDKKWRSVAVACI